MISNLIIFFEKEQTVRQTPLTAMLSPFFKFFVKPFSTETESSAPKLFLVNFAFKDFD